MIVVHHPYIGVHNRYGKFLSLNFFKSKGFKMAMQKVELKIKVGGILDACQRIASGNVNMCVHNNDVKTRMDILKYILEGNLEIEGKHSEEERKTILETIKKSMYRYFIYNENGADDMEYLHHGLISGNEELVKTRGAWLINSLVKPNPFIYNPRHGVYKKFDKDEKLESIYLQKGELDTSTRTYTLEIDDAKFSDLEGLLRFTSEALDRESFAYITGLMHMLRFIANLDMSVLKEYTEESGYHTLDELYSKTYEKTDVPLIDYGMKIICDKCQEIERLISLVKEMDACSNDPRDIVNQINDVLGPGGVEIVISIMDNLESIMHERGIQKRVFKVLEYMANNFLFFNKKNNSNELSINSDLVRFYEKCVTKGDLLKIVDGNREIIAKEFKIKDEAADQEQAKYKELEADLKKWMQENENTLDPQDYEQNENTLIPQDYEQNENTLVPQEYEQNENTLIPQDYEQVLGEKREKMAQLKRTINNLDHDVYFLECARIRENIECGNIIEFLERKDLMSRMSIGQQSYLLRKIKEFAETLNIRVEASEAHKIVEVDMPEEKKTSLTKFTQKNIIKMSALGFVFITLLSLLGYSKSEANSIANEDILSRCENMEYEEEPLAKKQKKI
ncbi:hypothetical protein NEMIN01_2287 [Nematocida minor]|uniref:uncharacterized protein n=1 Tax=Nematocida minor TaxID=1912983 RepID=UPI00221F6422|nr:uncharacterized protein NEMIN01_2287 [Nematocida minor]KAI5192917.1 hypothetical protein NEMIN01_2287 [Nematocida minor]